MKERPIIFSAQMVRAILSGAKTQTRRVMKVRCHSICEGDDGKLWPWSEDAELAEDFWHPCPFGKPGDRLWVRETFAAAIYSDGMRLVEYKADRSLSDFDGYDDPAGGRWRPSIHMPRWASRITLEITDVRVERLQDISEADAVAEGCKPIRPELVQDGLIVRPGRSAVEEFRLVWESINGPESWAANPWVWCITFRRVS